MFMITQLKNFLKPKARLVAFLIALLLNLISWALLVWQEFRLAGDVILHYTIYFGVDRFGPAWQIFYVPLVGLVVLLINFFLSYKLREQPLLVLTLLYSTVFMESLLVIMTVLLLLVNI